MANYLQFSEIVDAVEKAIKNYQSSMQSLVKSMINQVYLTEVLQADNLYPLHWLHAPLNAKFHATKTITGITAADPAVVGSTAHGFLGGEVISIWDVEGMTEINFNYQRLDNLRLYRVNSVGLVANTFKLLDLWGSDVDASGYTAYTSGGTIFHHGWLVAGYISDVLRSVTDIGIHDGLPLEMMTWKDLIENPDEYISNSSGTPYKYINFQTYTITGTAMNYALTFPGAQENKQAYMMIEGTGARLSADTDVPLLPPQFHDLLISGPIVRLAENNVQVENAVVWPSIYAAQLSALKTYNRKWWEQHRKEKAPYLL